MTKKQEEFDSLESESSRKKTKFEKMMEKFFEGMEILFEERPAPPEISEKTEPPKTDDSKQFFEECGGHKGKNNRLL